MREKISYICSLLSIFLICACGKYGPPIPPEALSPAAVLDLQVAAELQGVRFSWKAPEVDQRSKQLKSIEGYLLERKTIMKSSDIVDEDVEFETLAQIEDKHLELLEQMRAEAKAKGQPVRQVQIEDQLKSFEYLDTSVQAGSTYVYRIVPFNQGGVEGEAKQYVKVFFRGDLSEISLIPLNLLQEPELFAY